jgi:hypothetical protein
MFPEKHGINYSTLKMTPEGEYSITKRNDGRKMLQKMISILGSTKQKHITDLTGNVGGDTILFGLNFGRTDSIEIDDDNFEALKHNVETFKLKNVKLHHGDSTKIFKWKTDVLYIDPPWGGPEYKEKNSMDLFLGKERVDTWLSDILLEDWAPFNRWLTQTTRFVGDVNDIVSKYPPYDEDYVDDTPVCKEYPTTLPGYVIVKCTNLP